MDSYNINPVPVSPVAGCATWILAEKLNISAYDAGYVAIAYARGLPLWTKDAPLITKLKRERIGYLPH